MNLMVGKRPELSFSIGKLFKYDKYHGINHWGVAKRLFRYVIHTKHLGLSFGGTHTTLSPTANFDAD